MKKEHSFMYGIGDLVVFKGGLTGIIIKRTLVSGDAGNSYAPGVEAVYVVSTRADSIGFRESVIDKCFAVQRVVD